MKNLLYIKEYLQQAEKLYFKNNVLNEEDKENILSITKGDNFTRLMSDWYYYCKTYLFRSGFNFKDRAEQEFINGMYKYLKTYNRSIFPVGNPQGNELKLEDFNETSEYYTHVLDLYTMLNFREQAIEILNKLPSVAKRNLTDIRKVVKGEWHMKEMYGNLSRIYKHYKYLKGKQQDKAIKKAFKSGNDIKSAEHVMSAFAMGVNGNLDDDFDINDVLEVIEDLNIDILQKDKNVVVLRVNDYQSMMNLSGLVSWCFNYDEGYFDMYSKPYDYIIIVMDLSKEPTNAEFLLYYNQSTDDVWASTNVTISELDGYEDVVDGRTYLSEIGVDLSVLE